jgi:hypothetical protein
MQPIPAAGVVRGTASEVPIMRPLLLWLLGVPISVIILLYLFGIL